MASRLPRRAAEFDISKGSSALSSLGSFFSGGAGGVAQKLGSAAGRGITALTGGATRGAARAGKALGGGLGSFVASPGTLGGLVPRSGSTFTKILPGNPQAQPQAPGRGGPNRIQDLRPPQFLPDRPSSFGSSSGGGGGGGGMGPLGIKWAMEDRRRADIERWRIKEANMKNVSAYNRSFASANEANESRYQELLGIANATTGQRAKDITADFSNQQSMAMQNLASLGLANTSGASTIRGGFGRKKNAALDRLADQMQQTKLGIIERRTDKIPDLASLVSLGQLGISGLKF